MRYQKTGFVKELREVTPRRIAAAKTHLKNELKKHPLFAAEIAAEQPSPEERISRIDEGRLEWRLMMRKDHAERWMKFRRLAMQRSDWLDLKAAWDAARYPGTSEYFACFVQEWIKTKGAIL